MKSGYQYIFATDLMQQNKRAVLPAVLGTRLVRWATAGTRDIILIACGGTGLYVAIAYT